MVKCTRCKQDIDIAKLIVQARDAKLSKSGDMPRYLILSKPAMEDFGVLLADRMAHTGPLTKIIFMGMTVCEAATDEYLVDVSA